MRRFGRLAAGVGIAACWLAIAGCITVDLGGPDGPASGGGIGGQTAPGPAEPSQVVVPHVVGLPMDEAETEVRDAGLKPVDRSIHGPVEPEASSAEPGVVYKQVPAAGETVPTGTEVELSSWWESQ